MRETIYKEPITNYDILKQKFIEHNKFDYILYNALNKLYLKDKIKINNIYNYKFEGDKFSYILNFTNQRCILDAFNGNKLFIEQYNKQLQIIHKLAKYNIKVNDGKTYLKNWINLCIKTFKLENIEVKDIIETMHYIANALQPIVFIHVPKTGGSSFVNLLSESIINSSNTQIDKTHITDNIGHINIQHLDFSNINRIS